MSNLDKHSDEEQAQPSTDFGSALRQARERQKYSMEDVAELLKVPVQVIESIESSEIEKLPPATFTRGYLRAYARFVEIKHADTLAAYDRAVPQDIKLSPRSKLPGEPSSQSPLIKSVTYLLVFILLAGLGFAGYQYYTEKAGQMQAGVDKRSEKHAREVSSLDEPKLKPLPVKQMAEMSSDGELLLNKDYKTVDVNKPSETTVMATDQQQAIADKREDNTNEQDIAAGNNATVSAPGFSRLSLLATKGAWCEIRDARGKRLHYDMIPKGKWFSVEGKPPFKISLGNARSTTVKIDEMDVDMSAFIKPNNIAQFKVSTVEQGGRKQVDIR